MGTELVTIPPTGRPSLYSEELAERIFQGLESGLSLVKICQQDDMPDRGTVTRWMRKDESFAAKCACAREEQADLMDDRILDTVNKVEDGILEPDVGKVVMSGLQWRAAKLKPKKYGDKQNVAVTHTGAVGVLTADLPSLCKLITEASSNGASIEIQGDVPSGHVLPAEIRAE